MRAVLAALALLMLCAPVFAGPEDLSLMQRIERLERMAGSERPESQADLVMRLQELRLEVSRLRGQVELQAHRLKQMEQRQRELYLDVDRRLAELAQGRAGTPPQPPADVPEPPPSPVAAADAAAPAEPPPAPRLPPGDPAQEGAAYDAAFDLLKDGRYEEATRAFRDFLGRYPGGRFADNAQYWLGETAYVNRDFDTALAEFRRVVDAHPSSPKVADALLKIGYIQYEQQQWPQARETLERVAEEYPDATAAQLARQRLRRMGSEGR
jgi:tol-pal system protein YbgF